ncbi:MAG: 2-oxoglutarate dehydrogenase E1 component, partial [Phycisphaerales bacterium]|nr:2-oxoglutarate dehydrogenase E1 component [Phycisphaerales bacterium]
VMLLPHGYEGAGPEHSSCRIERFLELCGQNNMQVVYPSTAAQVFHMYRRQMERDFRKPLIVMTPKSMLRIPTSPLGDIYEGSFREMLDDPKFVDGSHNRAGVKRVILCSGKIYHELNERRELTGREDIAILRIEQIYPFHSKLMRELLDQYPSDAELVYVQEEPSNAASYRFVQDILSEELGISKLGYIGRPRTATPATGSKSQHKIEQEDLLTRAVGPKPEKAESKKAVASAKA